MLDLASALEQLRNPLSVTQTAFNVITQSMDRLYLREEKIDGKARTVLIRKLPKMVYFKILFAWKFIGFILSKCVQKVINIQYILFGERIDIFN